MQNQGGDLPNPRKETEKRFLKGSNLFHEAKVEEFWKSAKRFFEKAEKWRSGIDWKMCGKLCGNCEYTEYKGLVFHKTESQLVKKWKISVNTMPFFHNSFNTC